MPPLIVWGVGVLGGAALVRWAIKEARRINCELEETRLARMAEAMQTGPIPTLRRDPVTGAYRPE
jgi:Flp pilus assembly protein TadB